MIKKLSFIVLAGVLAVAATSCNHARQGWWPRSLDAVSGATRCGKFKAEHYRKVDAVNKIADFLEKSGPYFFATADQDQPRVRPFGTAEIFEGKLYIQTGKVKDVYKQLLANPKAEICGFTGTEWIRIQCELIPDERIEAKQDMLDKNPALRAMYKADDDNTIVLYLRNATATISSFSAPSRSFQF